MHAEFHIAAFASAADAFCRWIEAGGLAGDAAVAQARRHLAMLHVAALDLPPSDGYPDPDDVGTLSEAGRSAIAARLRVFPMQFYWEVFTALRNGPEDACLGDATDDLFDIYAEVKAGTTAFSRGDAALAAAWWRAGFDAHWGRHLVSLARALHEFPPDAPVLGIER